MNVVHANPIVVAMAESRPQEAMVANRYDFRVVTTGQGFVSVSELPTCMVPGPASRPARPQKRASLEGGGASWKLVDSEWNPVEADRGT